MLILAPSELLSMVASRNEAGDERAGGQGWGGLVNMTLFCTDCVARKVENTAVANGELRGAVHPPRKL